MVADGLAMQGASEVFLFMGFKRYYVKSTIKQVIGNSPFLILMWNNEIWIKSQICTNSSAFENAVSKMADISPECFKVIYKQVLSRLWMPTNSKHQKNYFVCHII